ncbi:MAG: HIT family protein [Planctomycetes bacterium]|nr:HIT family protein [Planctomycetota bacterium]
MTAPTFADIVAGTRPVQIVAEDAAHLAFLAERPARPGHVIVIPRRVHDHLFDLGAQEHAALWTFARSVGRSLQQRLPCARVCISVIGWVVRHAHIHLVPTDAAGQVPGLDGAPLPPAQMAEIAARLRA